MKSFEENPFAQAEKLMRIEFQLSGDAVHVVPVAIEELAYAHQWDASGECLSVYLDADDAGQMRAQVERLRVAGYEVSEQSSHDVEQEDWVAQSQASFAPIQAGSFFVHADNFEGTPPTGLHVITMNAGAAFGTGEHATTSGCLEAVSQLHDLAPAHVLDMGCGTAILSIAMVKQWSTAQVLAVDVDAVAVRVSEENVVANGVHGAIQCAQSDGYAADVVKRSALYDVIAANILANPLIAMAEDCASYVKQGGHVILSGFTESQSAAVRHAHEDKGLVHHSTRIHDGWATSVFMKP